MKDGRSLFFYGTASTFLFESVATSCVPLVLHHLRLPFMASNHRGFVAFTLFGQCHSGLFLQSNPQRQRHTPDVSVSAWGFTSNPPVSCHAGMRSVGQKPQGRLRARRRRCAPRG